MYSGCFCATNTRAPRIYLDEIVGVRHGKREYQGEMVESWERKKKKKRCAGGLNPIGQMKRKNRKAGCDAGRDESRTWRTCGSMRITERDIAGTRPEETWSAWK